MTLLWRSCQLISANFVLEKFVYHDEATLTFPWRENLKSSASLVTISSILPNSTGYGVAIKSSQLFRKVDSEGDRGLFPSSQLATLLMFRSFGAGFSRPRWKASSRSSVLLLSTWNPRLRGKVITVFLQPDLDFRYQGLLDSTRIASSRAKIIRYRLFIVKINELGLQFYKLILFIEK